MQQQFGVSHLREIASEHCTTSSSLREQQSGSEIKGKRTESCLLPHRAKVVTYCTFNMSYQGFQRPLQSFKLKIISVLMGRSSIDLFQCFCLFVCLFAVFFPFKQFFILYSPTLFFFVYTLKLTLKCGSCICSSFVLL